MTSGGTRKGAGRPPKPDHIRKQRRYIMLPAEVWEYLDSIDDSRGGNNRTLEALVRKKMK